MRLPSKIIAAALVFAGACIGWASVWATANAPAFFMMPERPVSILFIGDIMLDRKVAKRAAEQGGSSLVASTTSITSGVDLVVANLEGAVTDNPSIAQRDNTILHFTFTPSLAKEILEALHVSVVSLANNHTLDFGASGYQTTRDNVETFGILPFGHPYNNEKFLSTVMSVRQQAFCFVGYHSLFDADTSAVLSEIEGLKPACSKVIVFAHWGVEYEPKESRAQRSQAHAFIDAGADLVIGAHPHVVEPYEVYKGKAIFYSLGNFLFDQDFSWETTHGLAVRATFYEDKTSFTLIPLSINASHPAPAVGADRDRILQDVGGLTGGEVGVDSITLP